MKALTATLRSSLLIYNFTWNILVEAVSHTLAQCVNTLVTACCCRFRFLVAHTIEVSIRVVGASIRCQFDSPWVVSYWRGSQWMGSCCCCRCPFTNVSARCLRYDIVVTISGLWCLITSIGVCFRMMISEHWIWNLVMLATWRKFKNDINNLIALRQKFDSNCRILA